jgi:predicted flap endonuclease-1-like 5' DNA nuclease
VPSAGTDATGADVLGMDDDSVLVFGEVESPTGDRPALWRLRGDGAIDPGFGERGVWMPAELDGALALGLARDDDGAALIAVEREDRDSTWLEAYRWRPGMGELQRVARQAAPPEWRGPVSLERRGGLQWFDTSADVGIPLEQANLAAAPSADASSLGGVAFNPFAAADTPAAPVVEVHEDESRWLAWSAGLLVAAMLAAGWWRYRRPAVVDLGLLDTRQAQVEVALRDLRAASPPPPEPHAQERLERHDAGAPAASAPAPAQATEPDDLKRIKGIGPVLEAKLHAADVRHFRQIAAWTDDDIARFEARSTSFRGRVKRDAWIAQAAELARAADSASSPPTR